VVFLLNQPLFYDGTFLVFICGYCRQKSTFDRQKGIFNRQKGIFNRQKGTFKKNTSSTDLYCQGLQRIGISLKKILKKI
jgi:hypothetical protein